MLSMEMTDKIKYMYEKQGMTMEEIGQALHYTRKTVAKYVNGAMLGYHRDTAPFSPLKDTIHPFIKRWIEDDRSAPRKQRRTAQKMFVDLQQQHHYAGSYTTVKEVVREIKGSTREVFVPRDHRPGEFCEFDFGDVYIKVKGVQTKTQLHVFQLPYSNDLFGRLSLRATQEEMFDSHKRAFIHFEGIPHQIRYDNLSLAVKKILKGSRREETESFLKFRKQFGFNAEFCAPARGNEKGDVEGGVGYVRRNHLSPLPEINSLEELEQLNEKLLTWCLSLRKSRKVYGTDRTVGEVSLVDREAMLLLPCAMPQVGKYTTAKANHYSLVPADNAFYSVPVQYAFLQIDVLLTAREVVFFLKDQEVARHIRTWQPGEQRFDPLHYIELFRRKPYALINSKPIAQLPVSFRQFFEKSRQRGNGHVQHCLDVLELLRKYSLKDLSDALELAMAYDTYTADGVKNLLVQLTTSQPTFQKLESFNRPDLAGIKLQTIDLNRYNTLSILQKVTHHVGY
jgi:transposase